MHLLMRHRHRNLHGVEVLHIGIGLHGRIPVHRNVDLLRHHRSMHLTLHGHELRVGVGGQAFLGAGVARRVGRAHANVAHRAGAQGAGLSGVAGAGRLS